MFGAAECGCLWGCLACSTGLSLRQGRRKLAQTNWRSEAPQQFPIPILTVMPCGSACSCGHGECLCTLCFSTAWEGSEFSPAHICRAGPLLLARVQGSIFTAGSFPSLLLAASERLISLSLNRISRHRHSETRLPWCWWSFASTAHERPLLGGHRYKIPGSLPPQVSVRPCSCPVKKKEMSLEHLLLTAILRA